MGKFLISAGIALIVLGLIVLWKNPFQWMGRLPGDIAIEKENLRFYFPIVTCLVVSAVLSLFLYFFRR